MMELFCFRLAAQQEKVQQGDYFFEIQQEVQSQVGQEWKMELFVFA